ncbi:hypothetical protein FDP13_21275 [Dickeya sp. ws52]|nr:hypothetical protein FDP13_21275 [Dickeya sp. ws52]
MGRGRGEAVKRRDEGTASALGLTLVEADAAACAAREGGHTVGAREGTPGPTAEGAALCAALF